MTVKLPTAAGDIVILRPLWVFGTSGVTDQVKSVSSAVAPSGPITGVRVIELPVATLTVAPLSRGISPFEIPSDATSTGVTGSSGSLGSPGSGSKGLLSLLRKPCRSLQDG